MPTKISLKFVPKGPINNIPALVQIMAWRRPGDKPISEPMMVSLLAHICVTRPQWVNSFGSQWTKPLLCGLYGFIGLFRRNTIMYLHLKPILCTETMDLGSLGRHISVIWVRFVWRIYVSLDWVIHGSCNGLVHVWHQIIIWTNTDLLWIWQLWKGLIKVWIGIQFFDRTVRNPQTLITYRISLPYLAGAAWHDMTLLEYSKDLIHTFIQSKCSHTTI